MRIVTCNPEITVDEKRYYLHETCSTFTRILLWLSCQSEKIEFVFSYISAVSYYPLRKCSIMTPAMIGAYTLRARDL